MQPPSGDGRQNNRDRGAEGDGQPELLRDQQPSRQRRLCENPEAPAFEAHERKHEACREGGEHEKGRSGVQECDQALPHRG